MKLNETNRSKFIANLKRFLIPVGILYLTTLIGAISQDGHVLLLTDFVPNQVMIGGMILYALNFLLDYLMKIKNQQ